MLRYLRHKGVTWDGVADDVKAHYDACEDCLFCKPRHTRVAEPAPPPWDTSSPGATWHADLLVLPDSVWVLGLRSKGSRHVQFQVMRGVSDASVLERCLMQLWLPDCKLIVFDGEPRKGHQHSPAGTPELWHRSFQGSTKHTPKPQRLSGGYMELGAAPDQHRGEAGWGLGTAAAQPGGMARYAREGGGRHAYAAVGPPGVRVAHARRVLQPHH